MCWFLVLVRKIIFFEFVFVEDVNLWERIIYKYYKKVMNCNDFVVIENCLILFIFFCSFMLDFFDLFIFNIDM